MTETFTTKPHQELTKEQVAEIEEAKKHPVTFDEDCPELSPAMMKAFRCAVIQRNKRNIS